MMVYHQKKKLNMQNVVILIKFVFNKSYNHYCCRMFLEKHSYELAKLELLYICATDKQIIVFLAPFYQQSCIQHISILTIYKMAKINKLKKLI